VEQRRLEVVVDEIGPSLALAPPWSQRPAPPPTTKTGTTADPAPADPNIVSG
jgi:hypothetical protein